MSEYKTENEITRFGRILDSSFNEIYMFLADTLKFIQVNQGAQKNLGYTMEEMTDLTPLDLKPEFTQKTFEELIAPLRTKEKSIISFETEYKRKDGSLYPVEARLQLMHDETPPVFAAIIQDISVRKSADSELKKHHERLEDLVEERTRDLVNAVKRKDEIAKALETSENYLTKVIDNMVDGLITINDQGIIQSANPGAQKLFGYQLDELVGQKISMLMPEPDSAGHDQYIQNYLSTGEAKIIGFGREVVGLRKDGTVFPMDLAVSPVDDHKGLIFIGTIRDISARKQTEAELEKYRCHLEEKVNERTSALKKINEELEKFTYMASHDLQEPLRKVIIFGGRLQDCFKETLGEKGLDYIAKMQKASFRMKDLITDLLGYSRLSYRDNKYEIIHLDHIVQEVIEDLEIQIESVNGNIQIHDLPQIEADKIQIRQLFQNLISNGLKYTKPDAAPKIVIKSAPDGHGFHRISIADNGMGFDEKYKDKIFQPFQRLTSGSDVSGTGMGLFICKKIVERHNGTITVNSSLGKGSTFIVTLPENQAYTIMD